MPIFSTSSNVSIASQICSFIFTPTVPSPLKCIFNPRKCNLFPRVTSNPEKRFSISAKTSDTTFFYLCVDLLSSTYQARVHWDPSISLLAIHLSHGFILKPMSVKVMVYDLYHRSADSMQSYSALSNFKYNAFFPFSSLTYSKSSGFT